ncbi:hypothetical protein GCM10027422_43690 [Hymenobacter arcticus]
MSPLAGPLLAAHAASAAAWAAFVAWETRQNARLIAANGPADSLHAAFHAQRASLRLAVGLALAGAASALLAPHWGTLTLSVLALLGLFGGYFAWAFNPGLSRARGLPPYYVSFAAQAARWPDQYLAGRARRRFPAAEAAQRAWAAGQLRRLLALGLAASATTYLAILGALAALRHGLG